MVSRSLYPALALAALTGAMALPVLATSQTGPFIVTVTTSPNPYAILGKTSVKNAVGILAYGTATGDSALEGYATQPGSVGLEGFAESSSGTASNGVYGASENGSGVLGVGLSTNSYGVYAGNTKGGVGVYATSSGSSAIVGTTSAPSEDEFGAAGVFGSDISTIAGNSGVEGSTASGVGVFGETFGSNGGPLNGGTGGVVGYDEGGAVLNSGVYGYTSNGSGVVGRSSGKSAVGVTGTTSGVGSFGVLGNTSDSTSIAITGIASNGGYPMVAYNGSIADPVMSLDGSGNMILRGTLTQSGSPASTVRDPSGRSHVAFGERATQSTIEDFGQVRLVDGRAYVTIEAAFANVLDPATSYLVFVTPNGPASLFVANKTARGFEIRQLGGSSTLPVDYRIVAHPLHESDEPRLALLPASKVPRSAALAVRVESLARSREPRRPHARPVLPRAPAILTPALHP